MPLLLLLILIMTIFVIELLVGMKYFYISQNRLRNQNIVSNKDELQHKNHRKLS